jgi:hypothetical protein
MDYSKYDEFRDVNSVSHQLAEKLKKDFQDIIKPYLQQDFARPQYQTPTLLYQATVGTGKTFEMVRLIGHALEYGLRILVRAPTTKLAEEIASNVNDEYPMAAAVWYGRERDNPNNPACKMCPRHNVVSHLITMNAKPELACGTKKSGYCIHHPLAEKEHACGYRLQDLRNKSVVVVAGDEMLTLAPRAKMKRGKDSKFFLHNESEPDLLGHQTVTRFKKRAQLDGRGDFDLVILDETDPLGMVKGINETRYYSSIDCAKELDCVDTVDRDILYGFSIEIDDLIHNSVGRYLDTLSITCGLPDDNMTKLDILEEVGSLAEKYLRTPIAPATYHKMSRSEIERKTKTEAKARTYLKSVTEICSAMKVSLRNNQKQSPAMQINYDHGVKRLNVCTVNEVSPAYGTIPFVIFDATPRINLLEKIYGSISFQFEKIVRDGPRVKRFQLIDKTLSYQSLDDDRWTIRLALLAELLEKTHGEAGLICPLKVENTLTQKINTKIIVNHFGALRGDNSFEHLPCVVVASRQAQHYLMVEDLAALLTSQNIERLEPDNKNFDWYPKERCFLVHRSGETGWPVYNDYHPDPAAESVRAAITNDNLEQAIGRSRYVRRSSKPLHEYILTNVATSRRIDGVFTLSELKAVTSWAGVLLHAGIWLSTGKGMAIIFHIFRGLLAQRRDSLYSYIIGDPTFETPEKASKWRKDQLKDNSTIAELVTEIDEALAKNWEHINILHSPFPITNFRPVKAKIRGSRYFIQLYVRVEGHETPEMALWRLLGNEIKHIEFKPK